MMKWTNQIWTPRAEITVTQFVLALQDNYFSQSNLAEIQINQSHLEASARSGCLAR